MRKGLRHLTVGLSLLGEIKRGLSLRRAHADEFHFESAKVGVEILTDPVGDIDARALREAEFARSPRHVPTHRTRCTGSIVREFETNMALFHEAWSGEEPCVSRHEDRLWIAVAKRFKFAEPSGENRGHMIERKLSVDVKVALRLALGQTFRSALCQAALEFGQRFGRKREAYGKGVSAEPCEEVGASLNGGQQVKLIHGAA